MPAAQRPSSRASRWRIHRTIGKSSGGLPWGGVIRLCSVAMKTGTVRLFQTLDHACGYYDDRSARNLVIDPLDPRLARVYETSLAWGFRRAGGHVYKPNCRS